MSGQGIRISATFLTRCTVILLFVSLIVGCSGARNLPSIPENPETKVVETEQPSPQTLWGYYSGHANPQQGVFELTPLRAAETHFNLVTLMNQMGGIATQIMWADSDLSKNRLNVRILMVNPYATAPKFSGFDVRGILITSGSNNFGNGLWTAGTHDPMLLNLDGLTRWWNPSEFTDWGYFGYVDGFLGNYSFGQYDAKLNAFKMFADSLPETDDELYAVNTPELTADTGRGVFHNAINARRYNIQFPPGDSYFNYAIDVSWAEPTVWPPEVPDSFPPHANRAEAWYVRGEIVYNDLEYHPGVGTTGFLDVYVYVSDWQGRMLGAVAPQVSAVNLYSPELFGSGVGTATLQFDNGKQAIYMAHLTDICDADSPGTYRIGIEVLSSQGSYKQGWPTAPGAQIAAYDYMFVDVGGSAPPIEKVFGVHAWIIRKWDGTSPAATVSEIQEDIDWADEFWRQYGFGFELEGTSYVNSTLYYKLHPDDANALFNTYHVTSGAINVYYVSEIVGVNWLAFASLPCHYAIASAQTTYVMFGATESKDHPEVLAHEFGHNVGMLFDDYLLDTYISCGALAASHGCNYPGDVYCNELDAVNGNLMYWMLPWAADPQDYWISGDDLEMSSEMINSQAENAMYFHTHFTVNYKDYS